MSISSVSSAISAASNAFVDSSVIFVFMNLTSSKIAAIASAVLKSSSMASSYLVRNASASLMSASSFSVISPSFALARKSLARSAAVRIRSKEFFADSIKSALKFS